MMTHQKRLSAPKHYPLERKNGKYVVAGKGPHSKNNGVPISVLLRDVLGYAETAAEVKKILEEKNVSVNGKFVDDPGHMIGFMDNIVIDKVDKNYRVLVDKNGLVFKEVEDVNKRIYHVRDKTTLKGGKIQLNLDAGENFLPEEDGFKTGSSIIIDIEKEEIVKDIGFEEGNLVFITGGSHIGEIATLKEKIQLPGSQDNKVILEKEDGSEFETVEKYVFMVGESKPEVEI